MADERVFHTWNEIEREFFPELHEERLERRAREAGSEAMAAHAVAQIFDNVGWHDAATELREERDRLIEERRYHVG